MKKYKIVYVDEVEQFYQEICKGKAFKTVKFKNQKSFDELLTLALNKDEKDLNAQLIIAEIFLLKKELKKEEKTQIYQTALKLANNKDSRRYNLLGKCFYYGIGVEKNNQKAIEQFKTAANLNDAFGSYNLWYLSTQGVIDKKAGIDYLFAAAILGEPFSQIALAKDFLAERNYERAVNWFNKALKNNEKNAALYLVMTNLNQLETFPIVDSSFFHLIDPAESRDKEAQFQLGLAFLYGDLTKQNLSYGYHWLVQASRNCSQIALDYLVRYYPDDSINDYLYDNGY